MIIVVAALALVMLAVSLFSLYQGNVLAPLFAVFDIVLVALCLRWVWRNGDASDEIAIEAGCVRVTQRRGKREWSRDFNPLWVQLIEQPPTRLHGPHRVVLRSHGKAVELGCFLSNEQRQTLAAHVRAVIAQARQHTVAHPLSASETSPVSP